jgi:murein DD-endopeptidase MepM/ murein hydrolase activator NlpD
MNIIKVLLVIVVIPLLSFSLTNCAPKPSIIYPDNASIILSDFGSWKNTKGGLRKNRHNGIDISGKIGDPILAAAEGVIFKTENHPKWGLSITINHGQYKDGNPIMTVYYHNNMNLVREGDIVSLGDQIAELGQCPWCLTPHLHFSVWIKNNRFQRNDYFAKIGKPGKGWYPVSPHTFWLNGPHKITCYEPSLKISNTDFKIIYPVQCK